MAVASDIAQGTLTTSYDLLRTATTTENHDVLFRQTGTPDALVQVYANGTAAGNLLFRFTLAQYECGVVRDLNIGTSDTIYAIADQTGVVWADTWTGL